MGLYWGSKDSRPSMFIAHWHEQTSNSLIFRFPPSLTPSITYTVRSFNWPPAAVLVKIILQVLVTRTSITSDSLLWVRIHLRLRSFVRTRDIAVWVRIRLRFRIFVWILLVRLYFCVAGIIGYVLLVTLFWIHWII